MTLLDDVQTFVREANRVTEEKELQDLLASFVRELGFDYFALVHHVNIDQTSRNGVVFLFDFPDNWVDLINKRHYFIDDPVHLACQKSAVPFTWGEVPKLVALTDRQKEMLDASHRAGLGDGFTVPIHIPGEYPGSCTFSTRLGRELPREVLPAAHYVGAFAFEAARRVAQRKAVERGRQQAGGHPKLTRRQLDCVVLAGRGKSDRDVAQILGMSHHSVHQHMEDAKRKYDVATRMQLIVRALFDSQLAFADLVT
jgi:LuxR family transcriptional regulator, quorum-sensing system regulator CciR